MSKSLISVIISCYNYEKFVARAIESVYAQTYKNIELIVINDGSTDKSNEVIKEKRKIHGFKYFNRPSNGIVAVRNFGLSKATGEYIIQLDADDTLPDDYIETLVNRASRTKADIYFTPAINPANGETIVDPPEFDLDVLKIRNFIHASSMFKRETIIKYKYDQFLTDKGLEDWDINLAMCLDGATAELVRDTKLNYTQHPQGTPSRGQRSRKSLLGSRAMKHILDKNIQKYPAEMSNLKWFSDHLGRLLATNDRQETAYNNLELKYEHMFNYANHLQAQYDTIRNRKILKLYDTSKRYIKNPMLLGRYIRKKALAANSARMSEVVEAKRIEQLNNPEWKDTIFRSGANNLKKLEFTQLQETLVGLNNSLIDWKGAVSRHKAAPKKTKVSVIVLVLNNPKMTVRCIESVMNAKVRANFELIVVDNGSDAPTIKQLRQVSKKYPSIKLVTVDANLNFALGNNVGFREATGSISVFLNNDTYVTDGWLDHLVAPLLDDDTVRAVQPTLLYPDGTIQCNGIVFSEKSPLGYGMYVGMSGEDKTVVKTRRVQAVTGACLAVRSSDYAKMKGFDPAFVNGQEDVDLCLRLIEKNKHYTCLCVGDAIVYHDEGRTPGRGRRVLQNRKTFVERWAGLITPDDAQIYENDGYRIVGWNLDSIESIKEGVEIYVPTIEKIA